MSGSQSEFAGQDERESNLISDLRAYAENVGPHVEHCDSEQQTKVSLINPFIKVLGHDVQDPRKVRFEFSTDHHLNTRVDYAILDDNGNARILVEAKKVNTDLNREGTSQVRSYLMTVSSAAFVALTNGAEWRWFARDSDRSKGEEMEPFLIHNALAPEKREVKFLTQIMGPSLDLEKAADSALDSRICTWLDQWLQQHLDPNSIDTEFLKYLIKKSDYLPRADDRNIRLVREAWNTSFPQFIEKRIDERLKRAQFVSHSSRPNVESGARGNLCNPEQNTNSGNDSDATDRDQVREFETATGTVALIKRSSPRAWRKLPSEHWQVEQNAAHVCTGIMRYFASLHYYGAESYYDKVSSEMPQLVSKNPSFTARIMDIELGYRFNYNLGHNFLNNLISQLAQFVITQSGPLDVSNTVEWWIP